MSRRCLPVVFLVLAVSLLPVFSQDGGSEEFFLSSQPVDGELLREFMVDFNAATDNHRSVFERYLEALGASLWE